MAVFCLTKQAKENFKKALKSREIDPVKLAGMDSLTRNKFLAQYVGQENAQQVNALFESKLLMKNKKAGMIAWAKKISGVSPDAKRDILTKIERLNKVLSPEEESMFLNDLASTRLGINISVTEAKTINELSNNMVAAREKMKTDSSKKVAFEYGANRVALENYLAGLRAVANKKSLMAPTSYTAIQNNASLVVRGIANNSRAFVASFDNSLWGNQGIRAALNTKYTTTWAKNFAKSFIDIARVLAKGKKEGDAILDAVKAEIYSRENSRNGRYEMNTPETSKLAIGVTEEEIPTSLPSRIPVLGRLFKASEVAYEAGAMRLRADIADKVYTMAEKNGVNMDDKREVGSRNTMINSITGRGRIGRSDKAGDLTNAAVFSVRFFKSNLDHLTFGQLNDVSLSVRKEWAINTLRVIASTAVIMGIAKALDDDSVELDPRSSDYGKIKIGNVRFNIDPSASIVTLISRILTNSSKSSSTGEVKELGSAYGVPDGMDIFWDFTENKASPLFSALRDVIRRKDFDGNKPTPISLIKNLVTPMGIDTIKKLANDSASNAIFDAIAIGLNVSGINTSVYPAANIRSELIPTDRKISDKNFMNLVLVYSQALGQDPETAFNRIFTGQRIRRVDNGTIIVERMPLKDSQEIKKKAGKNTKQVKLDHTIPLELGGSNDIGNLKLVSTSEWESYTKVENALGRALKNKKVNKEKAQKLIIEFKSISDTKRRKNKGEEIIRLYK